LGELNSIGGVDDDESTDAMGNVRCVKCMGRVEVYSRQGRILLQVGALPEAAIIFERAHDELNQMIQDGTNNNDDDDDDDAAITVKREVRRGRTQVLINEGLLFFSHMDYNLAEGKFCDAVRLQRSVYDGPVLHITATEGEELVLDERTPSPSKTTTTTSNTASRRLIDTEEELVTPALNNMALCALYTCRMRMAVDLFEGLIREDPTKYLTECMVFNLCTLYELGSDNAVSERKKRILQLVSKRFSLHDVGADCFRLA